MKDFSNIINEAVGSDITVSTPKYKLKSPADSYYSVYCGVVYEDGELVGLYWFRNTLTPKLYICTSLPNVRRYLDAKRASDKPELGPICKKSICNTVFNAIQKVGVSISGISGGTAFSIDSILVYSFDQFVSELKGNTKYSSQPKGHPIIPISHWIYNNVEGLYNTALPIHTDFIAMIPWWDGIVRKFKGSAPNLIAPNLDDMVGALITKNNIHYNTKYEDIINSWFYKQSVEGLNTILKANKGKDIIKLAKTDLTKFYLECAKWWKQLDSVSKGKALTSTWDNALTKVSKESPVWYDESTNKVNADDKAIQKDVAGPKKPINFKFSSPAYVFDASNRMKHYGKVYIDDKLVGIYYAYCPYYDDYEMRVMLFLEQKLVDKFVSPNDNLYDIVKKSIADNIGPALKSNRTYRYDLTGWSKAFIYSFDEAIKLFEKMSGRGPYGSGYPNKDYVLPICDELLENRMGSSKQRFILWDKFEKEFAPWYDSVVKSVKSSKSGLLCPKMDVWRKQFDYYSKSASVNWLSYDFSVDDWIEFLGVDYDKYIKNTGKNPKNANSFEYKQAFRTDCFNLVKRIYNMYDKGGDEMIYKQLEAYIMRGISGRPKTYKFNDKIWRLLGERKGANWYF